MLHGLANSETKNFLLMGTKGLSRNLFASYASSKPLFAAAAFNLASCAEYSRANRDNVRFSLAKHANDHVALSFAVMGVVRRPISTLPRDNCDSLKRAALVARLPECKSGVSWRCKNLDKL